MKNIIILILLLGSHKCFPQNFFTSFFAGTANYQGDLEEKLFALKHSHPAWGLGLLFELNPHLLLRGDFTYGRISGSDANGVKNRSRNLSFTSTISDFSLGCEYLVLDLYDYKLSPYIFTGVSLFKFSPYTKDLNGNLFSLYDLDTEGEGFYENRKKYKLSQFCIPVGAGFQWALSDNTRVGIVIGIRKTFTDYLDDVSKTYVDKELLTLKRGGTAADYAYRGDELDNANPYPLDGAQRGNPKNKDWYYFSGLTLRVRLLTHKKRKYSDYKPGRSRITCPKPV